MSLPAPVVFWPKIELIRGATAHHAGQHAEAVLATVGVAIVDRQVVRNTKRPSAGNDGDFVNRDRLFGGVLRRSACPASW